MIGIIGGSGFYSFISQPDEENITTHFGSALVYTGEVSGKEVVFIPRHGIMHSIEPRRINYRANILAASILGVKSLFASNALGSIKKENTPGTFVIPDQILDFTSCRDSSFFDGSGFEYNHPHKGLLSGVIHTDVTEPFDINLRKLLIEIVSKYSEVTDGGTIAVANGPRYETSAEIKAYRILGASYVGMTSAPEAFLAKELGIPYATLGVLTNFAAGMQQEISHSEVESLFKERMEIIKQIFISIIDQTG